MAPPERGRPGFSRRAQYSIFTGYVAAIVGALLGLVLLVVAVLDPGSFAFLRRGAAEAAAPAGAVGAASRSASQGLFGAIGDYVRAGSQNAALRREVEAARVQQVRMRAVAEENRRLKALLGVIDPAVRPVTAARLIGSSSASTRRFAVLGAGTRDRVAVRMPVRSAQGLIGRVLEVGPSTARVLLVTDSENIVPVRRASDGVAAFSQGRVDGRLVLRLINLGVNPLKKGDVFVTSGSGGLYRPGIPVARVESLTPDGAIARIVSDPAAAEFVLVEPVFQNLPEPGANPPSGMADAATR
jgi:rod shape-determining protein MreC